MGQQFFFFVLCRNYGDQEEQAECSLEIESFGAFQPDILDIETPRSSMAAGMLRRLVRCANETDQILLF